MSNYIEILFKGERKDLYANPQQFPFKIGDYAIVEADKGEDLGVVNQTGGLLDRKRQNGPVKNMANSLKMILTSTLFRSRSSFNRLVVGL